MEMASFLGRHVSNVLESTPFKDWPMERSISDDLDEKAIHYVFDKNGFELRCDSGENVAAIFLYSEAYGGFDPSISGIPFALGRDAVLKRFGIPSKSGKRHRHPVLGERGAWDRFVLQDCIVHFEYKIDVDEIKKITLMQADSVPK